MPEATPRKRIVKWGPPCLYTNADEPGRSCHRPLGHDGDHSEFALSDDWFAPLYKSKEEFKSA